MSRSGGNERGVGANEVWWPAVAFGQGRMPFSLKSFCSADARSDEGRYHRMKDAQKSVDEMVAYIVANMDNHLYLDGF